MRLLFQIPLLTLLTASLALASIVRPFEIRYQNTVNGDIALAGNTLQTLPGQTPGPDDRNDRLDMVFINIEGDGFDNASAATLTLELDSRVLYAGLYWGARSAEPSERIGMVRFKTPGGDYREIEAMEIDRASRNDYYSAVADVTDLVKNAGEYRVADLVGQEGADRFAGWALVVVYENAALPLRNLTVFDGYAVVPPTVDLKVEGFQAPLEGYFNAYLGVVVYEGDSGSGGGDRLLMNNQALFDAQSPEGDFFNSRISHLGEPYEDKKPNLLNQMGLDIKQIDVTGLVKNGDSEAAFTFQTARDWYQPVVLTFATDYNTDLEANLQSDHQGALEPEQRVTLSSNLFNRGETPAERVRFRLPVEESIRVEQLLVEGQPVQFRRTGGALEADLGQLSGQSDRQVTIQLQMPAADRFAWDEEVALQAFYTYEVGGTGLEATIQSDADSRSEGTQPLQMQGIAKPVVVQKSEPRPESEPEPKPEPEAKPESSSLDYQVGLILGSTKPGSTTRWSGEALSEAHLREWTGSYGLLAAMKRTDRGHVWRASATLELARWNNAETTALLAGADYLFELKNAFTPYAGLRLGYLNFENDITGGSDSGLVYGPAAGVLLPTSVIDDRLEALHLELYANYLMADQSTSRSISGQTQTVTLEHLMRVGVGLSWAF
jgi:opacity protein-like surface antigen